MVDAIRELYQYPFTFYTSDDVEEQANYEEEEADGERVQTSGKMRGSKSGGGEEEYYEEEDYDEEDGNGRAVSPMLRFDHNNDEVDTSDGNNDD